jgi:hypothetical protein
MELCQVFCQIYGVIPSFDKNIKLCVSFAKNIKLCVSFDKNIKLCVSFAKFRKLFQKDGIM